ncbi:MAG: ATP-binding cassette domain-containing protein, partial [Oscillospiraceae bacterium]|nr:ATP-binding cassette domain-containing protein [Oscillospiraceae bacterium]
FEHVDFAYNADSPVLQGIDFTVPANHFWAVVGATGVGKSTLLSLLPRFYDPMAGRVLLDGVDVADCTLQSLRAHIGIVLQDVFLFNGTLRDNIKFGNPTVNDDAMRAAAEQACIRSFIESLPEGYDTVVGERGVRLSGGQKQRIAIARALLTDARVLILDEATSAVDTETEQDIQDAILQMVGTRTLLVIAHRLSTVRRADGIVVLKEGKIADIGTYEELEKRGSIG